VKKLPNCGLSVLELLLPQTLRWVSPAQELSQMMAVESALRPSNGTVSGEEILGGNFSVDTAENIKRRNWGSRLVTT